MVSIDVNFGVISEYKYVSLLELKDAIQQDKLINVRMYEESPNLIIINKNGLKYCISDGISIDIYVSKNLFTKLINQLISLKIKHSKDNIVDFFRFIDFIDFIYFAYEIIHVYVLFNYFMNFSKFLFIFFDIFMFIYIDIFFYFDMCILCILCILCISRILCIFKYAYFHIIALTNRI